MAFDSQDKRDSAIWGSTPTPDGVITSQADRLHLMHSWRGYALTVISVSTIEQLEYSAVTLIKPVSFSAPALIKPVSFSAIASQSDVNFSDIELLP